MKYRAADDIFRLFPGYVRGVVVVKGMTNGQEERAELLALLREAEQAVRDDPSLVEIAQHPRIASWRVAYSKFGARPSKFYSSIEAMLRRVRKGDGLPYINDLAAVCNTISLKYILPVGGHDLGDAEGDLALRLAEGSEPFTPLGSDVVEYAEPGEVVYVDARRVLCRRWTWRQAEQTKLSRTTSYVAINVDGLPPVTPQEVQAACEETARLVRQYCGGEAVCRYLSQATPEIEV